MREDRRRSATALNNLGSPLRPLGTECELKKFWFIGLPMRTSCSIIELCKHVSTTRANINEWKRRSNTWCDKEYSFAFSKSIHKTVMTYTAKFRNRSSPLDKSKSKSTNEQTNKHRPFYTLNDTFNKQKLQYMVRHGMPCIWLWFHMAGASESREMKNQAAYATQHTKYNWFRNTWDEIEKNTKKTTLE